MNKVLTVLLIFNILIVYSQENFGRDDKFRYDIRAEVNQQLNLCDLIDFHKISELEADNEIFELCEMTYECESDPYFKTYKIESYDSHTFYQEIYYTEKGVLIFAKETELYISKNDTIQWNCEYFFENGKLVDLISLGHAKTENENWNPELIIKKWQKRLSEY